ncbi:N-acetyltransferase [Heyndrickxia sporothermodurans]|nr:N-acetyltransferase [Heyndrickxia sporothermodurans]
MNIRKALLEESEKLSELAYESKAFWGYPKDFLDRCKDDLTVTAEYIKENPVYLMEDDKKIIAFYSFTLNEKKLDSLFIHPEYIGKGLGKILWKDLMNKAEQLNITEFTLDSEPHAEGFYLKMGAKRIGDTPSTIFPGRSLPLLSVNVGR